MANGHWNGVLTRLRRAAILSERDTLTDSHLLDRFLSERDEAAFEALLKRHGPMVLGVCRRILRNEADAHDAFQASFLVFLRKAACIQPRSLVGNWLYGVAYKTSLKAKAMNRRRTVKESQRKTEPGRNSVDPAEQELQHLLDQELSHLPDHYRSVIVLCELEGKTLSEVAQQLGCPQGTVASRLARARVLLARRLTRHGLSLSAAALSAMLAREAAAAGLPSSLFASTAKAATLLAAGQAATLGIISPKVVTLSERVVKTMLVMKLKLMTAALATVVLIGGGSLLACRELGAEQNTAKPNPELLAPVTAEGKAKPDDAEKDTKKIVEKTYGFLGVLLKTGYTEAVRVDKVFPSSPAAKAGIEARDVLLSIGDVQIKEARSVTDTLKRLKPGDPIIVGFKRDNKEMSASVVLGTWPTDADEAAKDRTQNASGPENTAGYLGLIIQDDDEQGVVVVTGIFGDSPAATAGLKPQDILLQINKVAAKDANGVIQQMGALKPGEKVTLHIQRGAKEMDVIVIAARHPPEFQPA